MAEGTRMQQRRATEAVWNTSDYVLAPGELGVTTDTGIIKIGNGTSPWSELETAFDSEYLPILGKAADSELLDGVSADFFIKEADTSTSPTPDTYVQRTGTGTIKGAAAVASDDLVPKAQLDTAISQITSRVITASSVLVEGDANKVVYVNNASTTAQVVVTIPDNATVAYPTGTVITVIAYSSGGAKISPAAGVTLNGQSNVMPGYGEIRLVKVSANIWDGFARNGGSRFPSIKYRRTVTGDNFNSYLFIPWDTLDSAETYNPDNEWFSIPASGISTARRIICNKSGEYLFTVATATNGGLSFCRIAQMTADNSTSGMKVRGVQSMQAVCCFTLKLRVAAGESFGIHHGSGSGMVGIADAEYTGGDPNYFKITRISD